MDRLLSHALSFPEAWEDHPWGETVVKVGKKVFVFLGFGPEVTDPKISVKLPESAEEALHVDGAVPTGYGLGRAGWVSIPVRATSIGLLEDWIEESYRTVAPKKLSKQLDEGLPAKAPSRLTGG